MKAMLLTAALSLGLGQAMAYENGNFADAEACRASMSQHWQEAQQMLSDKPELSAEVASYQQWFLAAGGRPQVAQAVPEDIHHDHEEITVNACGVLMASNVLVHSNALYVKGRLPEYVGNELRYWDHFRQGNSQSHSYANHSYATYKVVCDSSRANVGETGYTLAECDVTPV